MFLRQRSKCEYGNYMRNVQEAEGKSVREGV